MQLHLKNKQKNKLFCVRYPLRATPKPWGVLDGSRAFFFFFLVYYPANLHFYSSENWVVEW